MSHVEDDQGYFPLPESQGGWRRPPAEGDQARLVTGMDVSKLVKARAWNSQFPVSSAVVIIRRGYLVAEWYEHGARPDTRFNIYSCTKSFTGTAYGILFDDSQQGELRADQAVDLDTPAYPHIPAGYPLTDPRKAGITLRHLLSMSSGIPGESIGIGGVHPEPGVNPFEAALGRFPLGSRDRPPTLWADKLAAAPGQRWDYSDPAFAHLALAFHNITGQELGSFMQERVFAPIGLERVTWEVLGSDDRRVGQHTTPYSGLHISARELARFGYLMVRQGSWAGRQLVGPWWIDLAARSSQAANPRYGLTWWTNAQGTLWPQAPRDGFAAMGYNANMCAIIPSLDLVVVRIGLGPTDPTEEISPPFISAIVQSLQ